MSNFFRRFRATLLSAVLFFTSICGAATFDFVDTPISDVARSLSLAYDTPILVDAGVDARVTFHLEGVGVLEGLSALCSSLSLELVQQGKVFHIRKAESRGENYFSMEDSLVTVSVRDKDVNEFIHEFGMNTGLNILPSPTVTGVISGDLRRMPAKKAFLALMESHGFRVFESLGCIRVEPRNVSKDGKQGILDVARDENLYSVSLDSVSLLLVLREISRLAGLNLAVYGTVHETVCLQFSGIPLEQLLDALFKGSKYVYRMDSVSLFVSERGAQNALSVTRLYPLQYIHAEKALEQMTKQLPMGSFVATEVKEQNALLMSGSPFEIENAVSLLQKLDVPALQVTLSCVLVELKRGKSFEIGLRGGATRKTPEGSLGVRGFYDFLSSDASKSGAFGKIGILPDRFEMELASLEENNSAEVLARPRLTTLNGNKAELNVTNTVYYLVSQVSADGYPITDYRSFNDGISMELTPSVTQKGVITLEVSPEIKTAGRSTGDGPRDISTRNLKTTVVLRNGETLCLGGLRRKSKNEVRSAIPFLGSIPVIGRLFSYVSEEEDESELAIFITPEVNLDDPEIVSK